MIAFGGAGPLHAAEIARELNIPRFVIPRVPGHFSALGMLLADLRHDFVRTYYKPLAECNFQALGAIFAEMEAEARDLLIREGTSHDRISMQLYLDMRYAGQEFPIQTPIDPQELARGNVQALRSAFDRVHDRRFGHKADNEEVEVVNCRLTGRGRRLRARFPAVPAVASSSAGLLGERDVIFNDPLRPRKSPVYQRELLAAGQVVRGPAVVTEYASTTILFEDDVLKVAPTGELLIDIAKGG
jgi:N-methylhydantoinase A